ncbi:hypothetical protein VPH209E381_0021 [Vibrio phage 209E38-1]
MSSKPTKREIQLTLMAAGIQQFVDQIQLLDSNELCKLSGSDVRDCIVEIGKDAIKEMKPLNYTTESKG